VVLNLSGPYKLARDVSCENFDGEYVVFNLASGHYFSVSPSGSAVLDGIIRGFDLSEVTDALAAAEPARRDEIRAFLASIIDHGLVAPDVGAMALPLTAAWRDVARTVSGPMLLEAFDDIADLITADPIHDTDPSAGWPVRKDA
jgi:NADPH:quinone reductase-like Zn-dependent oxidoreductase